MSDEDGFDTRTVLVQSLSRIIRDVMNNPPFSLYIEFEMTPKTEEEVRIAREIDSLKRRIHEGEEIDLDTPGGFIRHFFSRLDVGVKQQFVELQATRANRENALPTRGEMEEALREMSSGFHTRATEIEFVADEYEAAATAWLDEYPSRRMEVGWTIRGDEGEAG